MEFSENMEQRNTRKGHTDSYMEARTAILDRSKNPAASEYMWLEVTEGKQPESMNYVIHASSEATSVPPFAIEVYRRGELDSYEVRRDVIRERAVMPEELRHRMVQAQKAANLIDRMVAPAASSSLAMVA